MNFAHTRVSALLNNLRSKIDVVMQRADARAELRDQIPRTHSKLVTQQRKSISNDSQFAPLFPRMNETDCALFLIYQINRATIGNVNAQRHIPLIGDQAIAVLT